jgi:hypothetical protein
MVDSPRTLAGHLDLGSADQIPVRVNLAQIGRATVTHLLTTAVSLGRTAAGVRIQSDVGVIVRTPGRHLFRFRTEEIASVVADALLK